MEFSQRQIRECLFFDQKAKSNPNVPVYFDSLSWFEDRPWNSYWFIDKLALNHYKGIGESVLDLGCGLGQNSLKLAKIGYKVYALDISPNSIALAKKLAHQYGLQEKIRFSTGIAEKLNFPSEYFDFVYGVDILHHVEIDQTIQEVKRVLKMGGKAFFREHLRVTTLDSIRETKLIKYFFPKDLSHEKGITYDEKKITLEQILFIRNNFKTLEIIKFELLSRFYVFFNYNLKVMEKLERIDWHLLKLFPFLNIFGGSGVFILQK